MKLSVVIPVYNEADNIAPLLEQLDSALDGITHEVILVDDGSRDATVENILKHKKSHIRLIRFARNFGQTPAMAAGIAAAEGEYIATMDGDLQNDPKDIPAMLTRLQEEELDVVMGRRVNRQDNALLRTLPSKAANAVIRRVTRVHMHDYGCTLKVFTATLAKQLDLWGELHRFIPILAEMQGAKIAEMDVTHHARQFGTSKYGLGRTFRVASDLLLMYFFLRYRQKPMHLFGTLGMGMAAIGVLIEAYLLVQKLLGEDIGGRPLFYVGILMLIIGVQFITTGFVAELLVRTYYGSQNKTPYVIAARYRGGKEEA